MSLRLYWRGKVILSRCRNRMPLDRLLNLRVIDIDIVAREPEAECHICRLCYLMLYNESCGYKFIFGGAISEISSAHELLS